MASSVKCSAARWRAFPRMTLILPGAYKSDNGIDRIGGAGGDHHGKNTVDVTDATFDSDVLKNDKTVLVDFWAEWRPPEGHAALELADYLG